MAEKDNTFYVVVEGGRGKLPPRVFRESTLQRALFWQAYLRDVTGENWVVRQKNSVAEFVPVTVEVAQEEMPLYMAPCGWIFDGIVDFPSDCNDRPHTPSWGYTREDTEDIGDCGAFKHEDADCQNCRIAQIVGKDYWGGKDESH